MPDPKRILILAQTASDADRLRVAGDKLALELVLATADDTGALRLDFATRDAALQTVVYFNQHPVAAIIPSGDATAPTAARAASMIGIPFHAPKAADMCVNKAFLHRRLSAAGTPSAREAAPETMLFCAMTVGKFRILAAARDSGPMAFRELAQDAQEKISEILRRLIPTLLLKHGPVQVGITRDVAITDVSLCYRRSQLTDALRFRIPLVDDDISYEELIIRNALDLDISRVHLDLK